MGYTFQVISSWLAGLHLCFKSEDFVVNQVNGMRRCGHTHTPAPCPHTHTHTPQSESGVLNFILLLCTKQFYHSLDSVYGDSTVL